MNPELDKFARFIGKWRQPLEGQSDVFFEARMLDDSSRLHWETADRFVQSLGFRPIGDGWNEVKFLPGGGNSIAVDSSFGNALSNDLVFASSPWLGRAKATECGRDFISCFKSLQKTILTNRVADSWHPISTATLEAAFVGFDDRKIALLLVTAED